MAPLHVATLTEIIATSTQHLPYLCTKNETMASLHVATPTIKKSIIEGRDHTIEAKQ